MSLRTFPLITHPAYLRFVEQKHHERPELAPLAPSEVPRHRPTITQMNDVADYLGVSHEIIRSIIRFTPKHYRSFTVKKRDGSDRVILAPRTFAKVVQWWILETILDTADYPDCCFGFIKGRSYIDNARAHLGATHILNVDIRDFFPSINQPLVFAAFVDLGYSAKVAEGLAALTTFEGALPQGAPTSPALANIIMRQFDLALTRLARAEGIKYTRYADDLTFSSAYRIPGSLIDEISRQLQYLGLNLNERKTRFMGPNQIREVTGLLVHGPELALSRHTINRTRGWLHSAAMDSAAAFAQEQRIRGTMAFMNSVGGRGTERLLHLGAAALRHAEAHRRRAIIRLVTD